MSCEPLINPACIITKLAPPVTRTLTGGIFDSIASAISEGIRWIVVNTATWWIQIPSPDLAAEPAVVRIQAWLFPITAVIAAGGVIAAGMRMAITRRANPLLDVSGGLLSLAAAITLGVIIPTLLLKAGDAWSSWVLNASTGGQFTQRLTDILDLGGKAAPAVVVVFGIAAMIVALVQAVLMLFRQITLIILAGVLPLAAAGTVAPVTRPWIRRITSWMLALICYKPAAAAVYAAAFTLIGSGGSTQTVLMGFVTLLLSVIMLPALMKLFTWTTGSIASQAGGQVLGAAAYGAVALGAMRSGSGAGAASAAQGQAAYLDSRLGPPPGSNPPPAPPSPPPGPGGGPSGTATPAASPAAPAGPVPGSAPRAPSSAPAGGASAAPASHTAATGSGAAAATGAAGASAASAAATSGGAAAAGPAGLAAAATIQAGQAAARTTARLADGAMQPEEGQQ